ncbi:MAG TPA: hypothetical protein VGQ90_09170 [Stellaceae bacterium]|nr:hypothetical protein [Stellaceae bacterium]
MASVTGSQLSFLSPNGRPVNLILDDGKTATGTTVPGAYNIEIFTTTAGTAPPGVKGTALIEGAVSLSGDEIQAGSPGSLEQLGTGAYAVIDHTGGESIQLGTGAQTVIGSSGDTITGGDATHGRQLIDLTGSNSEVISGPMTAIGGAGALLVEAGTNDSIVGGTGDMVVFGTGSLGEGVLHGEARGTLLTGAGGGHGSASDDLLADTITGAADTIVGGSGAMTVFGGTGDSITGGTGSLVVEGGVTESTIQAGAGGTTVAGGDGDVISDSVSGTLLVDIYSQSKVHGGSPSITGSGSETINLSAGDGVTTLRDIDVANGTGSLAATTVTGFSTDTDVIASKTSVSPSGEFLGTSTTSGGNTILTFTDGSTMTLAGITDISQVTFTK